MATTFRQVQNNSRSLVATAPSPATSGTSLIVTAATGSDFPAPGNGFWATIWNATLYADPTNDPNMEIVLVTARSTDTLTITRAQQGTAARTVVVGDAIALLWTAQNASDLNTAVNTAEADILTKSPIIYDAIVAPSGGDYTTVTAAYTAGKRRMLIVGDVVETGAIAVTVAGVVIEGLGMGKSSITLPSDNTKTAVFSGGTLTIRDIKLINPTTNLAASTDGWWLFRGAGNVIENCWFYGAGTAGSTNGSMIQLGKSGTGEISFSRFSNNTIENNNGHAQLIKLYAIDASHVVIEGTQIVNSTLSAFIVHDANNNDIRNLTIRNNYGTASSHSASVSFISITAASNQVSDVNIENNRFLINANSGGYFIRLTGDNSESLALGSHSRIVGNTGTVSSGMPGSQERYQIRLSNVPRTLISNNLVGGIYIGGSDDSIISQNTIYDYLITTAAVNDLQVVSNVFYSGGVFFNAHNVTRGAIINNTMEGASDFSYCIGTTIMGNTSPNGGLTVGLSGKNNNVVVGNTATTLTIAGAGHNVYGNYFSSSTSNTATDTLINGYLYRGVTAVGNALTGEDTLMTYAMGASRMRENGDVVEIEAWGTYAANANNKTVKLHFGTDVVFTTGALAINDDCWHIKSTVLRTGATTQDVITTFTTGDALLVSLSTRTAATQTLSGAVTIKCTGEATANDDISQKGMNIKYASIVG